MSVLFSSVHVVNHLGMIPERIWSGVCTASVAVLGAESWVVKRPQAEKTLREAGYAAVVACVGDAVVGYSAAVAITNEYADYLVNVSDNELEVQPEHILPAGKHDVWFTVGTCVLPQWQHFGLGTVLAGMRFNLIATLSEGPGNYYNTGTVRMVGRRRNLDGEKLIEKFGMEPVSDHAYELIVEPEPFKLVSAFHAASTVVDGMLDIVLVPAFKPHPSTGQITDLD